MYEDPIVAEVRRVREHLAGKFDFDVRAIFEDLRKQQAVSGTKLVRREIGHNVGASDRDSAALHPGR